MESKMYNISLHGNHVVAVTPDPDHEAIVVSKVNKTRRTWWDSDRMYGALLMTLAVGMAGVISVLMPEEGITAPIIVGMLGAAGLFHK